MAKFNLRPPRRRVKRYSTVSTPHHTYRNLLNNLTLTHPHQVWCSDLSRMVYPGTSWYLATIEDLATRQIIAAKIGKRHDSQLVLSTLHQALVSSPTPAIFHSDQGYSGAKPQQAAAQHGIQLEVVKLPAAKKGFVLLPRRWVVERSFGWMARFRRLARDYERLPATLKGLHFLAFAILMLTNFVHHMAFVL
jgi:transposase InsO family protein